VIGLRLDRVSVAYGSGRRRFAAVDDVTLEVAPRSIVGLVGESGSGKSTVAKAIVGLVPISAGRISLGGSPLTPRRRGAVQMVFQDPFSSLDPRRSVGDSIAEAIPRHERRRGGAAREEVDRLLELVGLRDAHAHVRPSELSGGQRQRVGLARALAGKPTTIVADEITSALDVSVQGAVLNLIRRLQSELDIGWLFISHNLAVTRYLSDQVAVMHQGSIVEAGPTATVLDSPTHEYTRRLLAAVPSRAVAAEPASSDHCPPPITTTPHLEASQP
jgi:peptide/nickel transport system ATP-binding protein